jgi:hypothetical protein
VISPDPAQFTGISQIGILRVVGMIAIASLSVIAFFSRRGDGATRSTRILPAVASLIIAALLHAGG